MIAVKEILMALKKEAAVGNLDKVMLQELLSICKLGRESNARRMAAEFRPDQRVQFLGRRGQLMRGRILKINPTSVAVEVDVVDGKEQTPAKWRVSTTLLTPEIQMPTKLGKKEKVPA